MEWPPESEGPPSDARALVHALLTRDPAKRLGTANGAAEVKAHAFFASRHIEWEALLRQKAEFVPNLADEEDTSYFDSAPLSTREL